MRVVIIGAALALTPAAPILGAPATHPIVNSPTRCPDAFSEGRGRDIATAHKLTELPPANAYRAVFRMGADGCTEPVIAASGIGSSDQRGRATKRR